MALDRRAVSLLHLAALQQFEKKPLHEMSSIYYGSRTLTQSSGAREYRVCNMLLLRFKREKMLECSNCVIPMLLGTSRALSRGVPSLETERVME